MEDNEPLVSLEGDRWHWEFRGGEGWADTEQVAVGDAWLHAAAKAGFQVRGPRSVYGEDGSPSE